jgi:lysophospholipase L1-like esterase
MILYVNGDSHSVGHGIHHENGMIFEDAILKDSSEAPHPANLPYSYGAVLANKLGADLVCQARSGGSVARSIRTTKQFVNQTQGVVFVLIGLPSIERDEWFYYNAYYQINASGHEKLPQELQRRYKEWVAAWSSGGYDYYARQKLIYHAVVELHQWLAQRNVKHLFFHTAQVFNDAGIDFGVNFVEPYGKPDSDFQFSRWLLNRNYKVDSYGHFGADGHQAWAEFLLPYINKALK